MSIYLEIFFCPPSVCSAQRAKILIISNTGRDWSWHRTLMRAFHQGGKNNLFMPLMKFNLVCFCPPKNKISP